MVARCAVGWLGGYVGASSFGWFLGGFRWFLLVEDNFGWFQVVFCFSRYTNCTAYKSFKAFTILVVVRDGLRLFNFFYLKWNSKKKIIVALLPSSLKISDYYLCFIRSMSDKKLLLRKFFEYTFTKHKARVSITKYLRRRVLTRSVWKIFKNREIIRNHREVGRNEPKWGDLLVGWRETAGL